MKLLLLLFLSIPTISVVIAQTPSEKLFKKYGNKEAVEYHVTTQSQVKDSIRNTMITTVIKTMSIDNDDKANSKFFKKMTNACVKLLKRNDYMMIHRDKDDDESITVCKYAKNGVVELCVLSIDEETLTLTSTRIIGLTDEGMKNVDVNFSSQKTHIFSQESLCVVTQTFLPSDVLRF